MPTIFDTLIPQVGVDSVAIFDQDFNQLFKNAKIIKAVVKPSAKVMEHPLEDGSTTVDHRILRSIEIELSILLHSSDYVDIYRSISQYYKNATLLIVQTRAGVYQNQLISEIPHEESPEQYEAISLALKLTQTQFAQTQVSVIPKAPKHSSTVNRGVQNPVPIPIENQSFLAEKTGLSA